MAAIGDIARISASVAQRGGKGTKQLDSSLSKQQVIANQLKKQEIQAKRQAKKQAGFDSKKAEIRQRMADRKSRGPSNFSNYAEKEKRIDFYSKDMSLKDNLRLNQLERQANKRTISNRQRFNLRQQAVGDLADRKRRMQTLVDGGDGKFYPHSDPHTLDGKGSFMKDTDWERLAASRGTDHKKSMREASPQRKARRKAVEQRRTARAKNEKAFEGIETGGFFSASLETGTKLARSATRHFGEEGNIKRALIGTAQTSAVSAVGHGGLAALQGEDPWEAAKTGAIRGAFVGAGYQGLKGATGVNTGSIRGNISGMAKTTRGVYKAHTPAGYKAATDNPESVSHLVRKVVSLKSDTANLKNKFNFGGL